MFRNLWRRASLNPVAVLFAVAGALAAPSVARAQSGDLPKAEALIERYIEVTGGKAAYEKLKSRIAKGSLEMAAQGVKGTLTIYQAAPNKMYTQTEITGIGGSEEGCDGEIAWEKSTMMGPRLKTGDEKALALRGAVFNAELHWRKFYKKAETVGIEDVNGKPAYKVEMTPNEGKTEIQFYDKESGLVVKSMSVLPTQMGDIPVESYMSDYREVDGVKMSHKLTQKLAMQEVVVTMEKIEHNKDIPASRFELPPEIKALFEKSKGGDAKPAEKKEDKKTP